MKKLTILGIVTCVVMLLLPVTVMSAPAGPPEGLDVNIINPLPVPVEGDVNATVTGDVNVTNTPLPVEGDITATVSGDVEVANTPLPVTEHTVYRFVGFSGQQVNPQKGVGKMHEACQGKYGPNARMCTTIEWWKSTPNHTGMDSEGWVQPSIVAWVPSPSVTVPPKCIDETGATFEWEVNGNCGTCEQWRAVGDLKGAIVSIAESGGWQEISSIQCEAGTVRPVTCCVPVEELP